MSDDTSALSPEQLLKAEDGLKRIQVVISLLRDVDFSLVEITMAEAFQAGFFPVEDYVDGQKMNDALVTAQESLREVDASLMARNGSPA
jgi:hypothetical protein